MRLAWDQLSQHKPSCDPELEPLPALGLLSPAIPHPPRKALPRSPRKGQAAALTIPVGGPQHGNNVELWKAQKTLWEINEDWNRTLFGQNEVFCLSA